MKVLETQKCSDQNLSNFLCQFEMTNRFLCKFCIPLQFHERLFQCTFLAQTLYTLLKRSPLKWKFLRLSSGWVKYSQTPYANFEMSGFLHKFYVPLQFFESELLYTFFSSRNIYFAPKEPIKIEVFETYQCSGQILSNPL